MNKTNNRDAEKKQFSHTAASRTNKTTKILELILNKMHNT